MLKEIFQNMPLHKKYYLESFLHRKISPRFITILCVVLILAFGFALRMHRLSKYDFWYDEIFTTFFTYPFYENFHHIIEPSVLMPGSFSPDFLHYFWKRLQWESQPPFYYAFIYIYSFFFRQPISLRFLSVVFSMLSLVVSYAVARKFLSRKSSLVALGIMAFSAFHLWHSQEARGHAMACFFSISTVYCFFCVRENKGTRWWLAFWSMGVIAMLSSYYAVLLLFFLWVYLVYKNKPQTAFLHIVFSAVIWASILVLLLPLMFGQLCRLSYGYHWMQPPLLRTFFLSPLVFTGGYLAQPWQMVFGIVMSWVLLLAGVTAFFRENKEKFLLVFSFSLLSVILIFMVARIWAPIYIDRQLIIFTPFYYILIAKGIESIRIKNLKFASIFLIFCFLWMALSNFYRGSIYYEDNRMGREFYAGIHPRKEYMPLVKRMFAGLHVGDKIVVADKQSFAMMLYVLRFNPSIMDKLIFMSPRKFVAKDCINLRLPSLKACDVDELYAWPLMHNTLQKMKLNELSRFWLVGYSWGNTFASLYVHEVNLIFSVQYIQKYALEHDGFFVWLYDRQGNE